MILLCVLAWPLLALLGLTLRARLVGALCLIAIYVPVTGAGPSIQRAGVMGAAGLIAALADRPRSRWYAVLLAAAITLAINPAGGRRRRLAAQLRGGDRDHALGAGDLAAAIAGGADRRLGATRPGRGGRRDGLGDRGDRAADGRRTSTQLSPAALPANVLAPPAVAPAMWLGMLTGIAGQLPLLPVEPLNWLDSLCLAYIAQVAHWLGRPGLGAADCPSAHASGRSRRAYAALLAAMELLLRWLGGADGRAVPIGVRGAGRPL